MMRPRPRTLGRTARNPVAASAPNAHRADEQAERLRVAGEGLAGVDRHQRLPRRGEERERREQPDQAPHRELAERVAEARRRSPAAAACARACSARAGRGPASTPRRPRDTTSPFSRKHSASPAKASTTPAIVGPTKRAPLKSIDWSAIAFGRSALLSTISSRNAWRVGVSNAFIVPSRSANASTCQTCTTPVQVSAASASACTEASELDDDQQPPPVEPVGPDAGDRRDEQHRELQRRRREAEHERRAGQPVDEPARRDRLHPGAEDRQALAGVEDAEAAIAERSQRGVHRRTASASPSGARAARGPSRASTAGPRAARAPAPRPLRARARRSSRSRASSRPW